MINEIRSAFKEALDRLNWMDDHTRQAAKDKVQRQVARQGDRQVDRKVDRQVDRKVDRHVDRQGDCYVPCCFCALPDYTQCPLGS